MLTTAKRLMERALMGSSLPTRSEIYSIERVIQFTPDFRRLQEYEWQLLFVPDELKKGHIYHHLLGEEKIRYGVAFTQDKFAYYQKRMASENFPVLLNSSFATIHTQSMWTEPHGTPAAPVMGELYAIRPHNFLRLDRYRENGVQFTRRRVKLDFPYREVQWFKERQRAEILAGGPLAKAIALSLEKNQRIKAWMYVGDDKYWNDILGPESSAYGSEMFSPVRLFHKKRQMNAFYYNFTKPSAVIK